MSCSQRFMPKPGFPVREVITLAFCVSVNYYTVANLFPYVGVMVRDMMELDSINEAGFYAGYVASAFTLGRFVSGYVLGYVSDKVRRKPVIIAGLSSIIIFSVAFGLSPNFTWAVSSRLMLGLTNGTMAASRTSLREVCGPQHVVIGMTYLGGGNSLLNTYNMAMALVVGTCIGSLLVTPALHYPDVFSSSGIFARYPFLLPNLIGAAFAFVALPMVIFWLKEKIHVASRGGVDLSRLEQEDQAASTGMNSVEDPAAALKHAQDGLGEIARREEPGLCGPDGLLRRPLFRVVLVLGCLSEVVLIGFDEVLPLWTLSTPDVGGLGWDAKDIGLVLFTTGALMGVLQLGIFPSLIKIFSMVGLALMIASTNIVPLEQHGKFSGLYNNTSESLGRFLGPAGYAITYALSISSVAEKWIWMDYHFIFYVSAMIMVVVSFVGWWTFSADVFSRPAERVEGSDDYVEVIFASDRIAANDDSETSLSNSTDPTECP